MRRRITYRARGNREESVERVCGVARPTKKLWRTMGMDINFARIPHGTRSRNMLTVDCGSFEWKGPYKPTFVVAFPL